MANTDCGWCGRLAYMEAASALTISPSAWSGTVVQAAYECPNCHKLNIAQEPIRGNGKFGPIGGLADSQNHAWGPQVKWQPKKGQEQDFPDVPEHIALAAKEATLCRSFGAYRAVGSLARAVIEATAKEKEANGRNLEDRIDALAAAGHIREHTKAQAHEIRYFGNTMAHGDFADPTTEEEAAEVIELMSEVLNEVYQSPAKLARVKEAREARKAAQKAGTQPDPPADSMRL